MCAPFTHYLDHDHAALNMSAIKHQHEMLQVVHQYQGCPFQDDLAYITGHLLAF